MAKNNKPKSSKVTSHLDRIHKSDRYGFTERFAEHFALENMGFSAPRDLSYISELCMDADGAATWSEEMRGWRKVAAAIQKELMVQRKPLTIRDGIKLFEASEKKYQKLYAST